MKTRRLLWPVLAAALLAQPAAASASRLIYQCHDDLCSIRPDGGGRERLTRDGHRMPYTDPSVSRDGRRLAFGHADARAPEISDSRVRNRRTLDLHNHSVPMRPLMRPDGRVVMWARGAAVNSSTGLCTAPFTAPRRDRCQAYDHSYERAWGPRGSILLHWIEDGTVCRFSDWGEEVWNAHACRHPVITTRPGVDSLESFTMSPDGRLLAVSEDHFAEDANRIAIYSLRTGRFVRELARGSRVQRPVFSPDGRWVAFRRWNAVRSTDGWDVDQQYAALLRVPTRGGRVRTIIPERRGVGPATWGR